MKHSIKVTFAAIAAALSANCAFANKYNVVSLGFLIDPVSISNVNAVAANTVARNARGQIYRNDGWRNLPTHSHVTAINRSGNATGNDYHHDEPFLWPHNDDPVILRLPHGAQTGSAYALNNGNVVVGKFFSDVGTGCFTWTAAEGANDFSSKEWQYCTAYGVNEAGQVVGTASVTRSSGDRAFIWQGGTFTDLGVLPGKSISQALAINEQGHAVGASTNSDGARAFLWNGALVDLDPSERFDSTTASAINDSGEIVGWAMDSGAESTVAVRFAHSTVIRLDSEIIDGEGWKFQTATSINNKGVIVGSGQHHGQSCGYMLIPQKEE